MQKVSKFADNRLPIDRVFALKLYVLDEQDRAWIISRIPQTAQEILLPMLQELNDLGIELGSDDIDAIEALSSDNDSSQKDASLVEQMTAIDDASYSELAIIFSDEPRIFWEYLSSVKPWRWKKAYEEINVSTRILNDRGASLYAPTLATKNALINFVARQLEERHELQPRSIVKHYDDTKKISKFDLMHRFFLKILA